MFGHRDKMSKKDYLDEVVEKMERDCDGLREEVEKGREDV